MASRGVSWSTKRHAGLSKPFSHFLWLAYHHLPICPPDIKFSFPGTSLVVQWLRLRVPDAGGLGSIPGQGTSSHMPQLKILHAATKTHHSQINMHIYIFFNFSFPFFLNS